MNEYIQALTALNHKLSETVASQQEAIVTLAIKIKQLEVSVQTGAWYPLEKAQADFEKVVYVSDMSIKMIFN